MTVVELIAILHRNAPARIVVVDGAELYAGHVLPVQLRKVSGTPEWGGTKEHRDMKWMSMVTLRGWRLDDRHNDQLPYAKNTI